MKSIKSLQPGQRVRAYVSVEGRSLWGKVLNIAQAGVWIQLAGFPAPMLFPHKYIEAS